MSAPCETAETFARLLDLATAQHRAGELAEARRIYAQVLAARPEDTLALFRSGLLELQDRQPEAALALIARAVAAVPDEVRYQFGLAQVLQTLGRCEEAAHAYRRILQSEPDSADAHFGLGMALQSLAQQQAAILAFERAVQLRADFPEAFNNLGISHQLAGQLPEAAAAYGAALALRPGDATFSGNMGAVLRDMGELDQAVAVLRAAAGVDPLNTAVCINLSMALCQRRDFAAAESVLRTVIAREPGNVEAAFNLGCALDGLARSSEAIEQYRHAVALRPGYADAWNNLANACRRSGDFAGAMAAYRTAIAARPRYVAAFNNLGCLLRTLGRSDEAEAALRQGLEIDPDNAALHDNLGNVLKDGGQLDAAITCFRRALDLDPDNAATHSNLAYALSFQSLEPEPILDECRRWNARFAAPLLPAASPGPQPGAPQRRLRIGYVSADFRDHCQSLFTLPLLAHHDPARYEIFCYSSVERPDEFTQRAARHAEVWRDVGAMSDAALCEMIRSDGIDILVDLTMHMAGNRLLAFARRPAPVQIAWLAYPGTTGMAAMDYRLSDPRLDPEDCDAHYSERTLRLADSFWCYDPLTARIDVGPLPALERGHLTLGCLNNPCKLTERTLDLWGGVMRALPSARLLLMAPAGSHRTRLLRRLAVHDIAAARVDFVPFRPRADYLKSYRHIDLGLDTLPYNGHTTSLDALWMGVPTLTRVGGTCVGRGGWSQLYHLQLLDLVAHSDAEFVDTAVAFAADLPRLAALRHNLRARLQASPLMDAQRFARNIEAVYARAWAAYLDGV